MVKGIEKSDGNDKLDIGKQFVYPFDGLKVMVEIKGVRTVYGRKEWHVGVVGQPSNEVWIYAQDKAKFVQ